MASSSTSGGQDYLVFLSFRGDDTREGLVSHLYSALCKAGIKTFMYEDLPKGDRIENIFKVIEQSRIYIVVYSKDYASSEWCLDEVVKIMKCTVGNNIKRHILPIFYKVNPSEVRCQKGITGDHLEKHEMKYGKNSRKITTWKAALMDLAEIAGWHFKHGAEAQLVIDIVNQVLSLLKRRKIALSCIGNRRCFLDYLEEVGKQMIKSRRAIKRKCKRSQEELADKKPQSSYQNLEEVPKQIMTALNGNCERKGQRKGAPAAFSYDEILKITDNFKTTIRGGLDGEVYLGTLTDGTTVAVKMPDSIASSRNRPEEFETEVPVKYVHHRNLISLVGYGSRIRIFEFVANGNLQMYLSESKNIMTWRERVRIAMDVAEGLDYLHNRCVPPIIHGDMTSANILLDAQMQAKIANYWECDERLYNGSSGYIVLTGTNGYIDPEYLEFGILNTKFDVYSFGIILLELITGKPAVLGTHRFELLVDWAIPIIDEGDISSIIDPLLNGQCNINSAGRVVEIAKTCVSIRSERPDISQVLAELNEYWECEMKHN